MKGIVRRETTLMRMKTLPAKGKELMLLIHRTKTKINMNLAPRTTLHPKKRIWRSPLKMLKTSRSPKARKRRKRDHY